MSSFALLLEKAIEDLFESSRSVGESLSFENWSLSRCAWPEIVGVDEFVRVLRLRETRSSRMLLVFHVISVVLLLSLDQVDGYGL